jgi:hypothetical protein
MTDRQISIYQAIHRFAGLLMLLFGAVAALGWLSTVTVFGDVVVTQVSAGVGTLFGVLSRWAALQVPSARKQGPPTGGLTVALVVLAVCLMLSAGCTNLSTGYRALTVAVKVTNEGGRALASVCKTKRLACVERLGTEDKVALRECLGDCLPALKHWVQIVKPAVSSGVVVTFAALEASRDKRACKASAPDCKDWIARLRPWGCVLVRGVTLWRDLLGDAAAGFLNLLGSVEGLVCHD